MRPAAQSGRRERRRWGSQRTPRDRLLFDAAAGTLIGLALSVWTGLIVSGGEVNPAPRGIWSVARPGGAPREASAAERPPRAPTVVRTLTSSLTDPRAQSAAYLEDAALKGLTAPLRGRSGKLKAIFRSPAEDLAEEAAEPDPHVVVGGGAGEPLGESAPGAPGVYPLAVALGKVRQPLQDLRLITMVPFSEKKNERIGLYYLGSWPYEAAGRPRSPSYANPTGFIAVTRENRNMNVSEHFRLGDFLTKDQPDVWPKYVLIDPKLLDKLELTIEELKSRGHRVEHVHVMSGFRTPRYNSSGGNTGGRANLSRHMYGDGADVYVDNNRDGSPDDLSGDGRVDTKDAAVFGEAAERVERREPALVGGVGIYKACCGHGPFTHIDTRGYRARWHGEGAG